MTEDCKSNVTQASEDANDGEVDFETVYVVVIEETLEPPHKKVVPKRKNPGRTQGVVCADIGEDGKFGWEWHA